MRILVATDRWFPDVSGGSGRVAAETSRRLAARGHEVTVLAPAAKGIPTAETEDGLTVLRHLARGLVPQSLSDTVSARRWGRRLAGPFDLLLAHQVTVAAGLKAALPRVPLALVYHASTVREARLRSDGREAVLRRWSERANAMVLGRLERTATDRADRVLVLSDYSRSLVVGDHPALKGRVTVVRGGVDTETFSPGEGTARATLGIPQDETLIVSIRRLERQLGLETLLRAFARAAACKNIRLAIVGDGSFGPRLRDLASEFGVSDRVRFVGAPDQATLREWYRAADLFVLAPAPHEGFGLATLEALASGTPVVAAPVGANEELLAPLEPRLVARSANPDDLATAILSALDLEGPDLRHRCRSYAVSRFAWDRVIEAWEGALTAAGRGGP